MRALVVEDDPVASRLFERVLTARDHDVVGCADAGEARTAIAAGPVDLALIDIQLPGTDGVELCRELRRHAHGRATAVIFTTAVGPATGLQRAIDAGGDDYLHKPVDTDTLNLRLQIAEARARAKASAFAARTALAESEERFAAFMRYTPAVVFIKDADGRYTYINPTYERTHGLTLDQLAGRTDHELWPRDVAEAFIRADDQVRAAGRPIEIVEAVPQHDGVHHWLTWKFPLPAMGDDRQALAGIAIDATTGFRAEEDARRQAARAQALLHAVARLNASADLDEVFDTICREAATVTGFGIVGLSVLDPASDAVVLRHVIGFDARDEVLARLRPAPWAALHAAYREHGPVMTFEGAEAIGRLVNGPLLLDRGIHVVVHVALRTQSDTVLGMMSLLSRDPATIGEDEQALLIGLADHAALALSRAQMAADRERLEAQVQHAQKLESLGVLAGGIAHDFNNLLVGILGNAGLALLELGPDSPARARLEEIEASAQRAADLTRQMLAYAGRGQLVWGRVDITALVEEMATLLARVISKKARLTLSLANRLPAVTGDATQLRQIVMNLITNASDALGDQVGTIAVSTGVVEADRARLSAMYLDDQRRPGRYVVVEVSDTGAGMSPDVRARIFDPFFTTKVAGRGLGLAAVLGIIRGHKGGIEVDSEPGKGSTFRVLLPEAPGAEAAAAAPTPSAPGTHAPGQRVLIVDDEESVRSVARAVLERAGFTVLEAESGEQALALVQEGTQPDVLLLDMTMPGMDGTSTLEAVRRVLPDMKAVFSSGFSQPATASAGLRSGTAFIQKPYRPADLVAAIRGVFV